MRLPTPRLALLCGVVLSAALATACASASSAGGRTSGMFDEEGGAPQQAYGGGGYGAAPGMAMDSPAPTAMTTSSESAPEARGLFEFDSEDTVSGDLMAKKEAPSGPPPPPPPPRAGEPVNVASDAPSVEAPRPARLVIYKGSLTVLVTAVEASVEKLVARAQDLGGYVENQTGNSGSNQATLTMRVPADKFYALVNEMNGYGQVTQKQVSANDVTKQVFDIELRLETAEKSRQRLLELLKIATKMDEILQIENQVRRLTQEIESMKGELRFIKDQVSFSTLAVTFYSNAPPPNPGPSRVRSRFDWINQVGIEAVLYQF